MSFVSRLRTWLRALQHQNDVRRFRLERADYYEYLSDFMHAVAGARTLKDIFEQDARRYGPSTHRGRLSAYWSTTYPLAGGDLHAAWRGSFPEDELVIIRVAQLSGNAALIETLRDLAASQRLVREARDILVSTLTAAVVAVLVWVAMMLVVPMFTVPRLKDVFGMLPVEYYGQATRELFGLAGWINQWWPGFAVLTIVMLASLAWTFPNLVGTPRRWLDHVLFWRLYRCVAAVRMLSVLHVVLARNDASSTQLRTAISLLCRGASRWHGWHLSLMIERIDRGWVGAQTFDTGLLDRPLFWYLQDLATTRGLVTALTLCKVRLANQVLKSVAHQAAVSRWVMLLGCVASLRGLGLWHYVVIDELRRSLMTFYASQ